MQEPAITIHGLNIWYKNFHAAKGVSITVPDKGITAFMGASGSGKSTVLKSVNRMLDSIEYTRIEGSIRLGELEVNADGVDLVKLRQNVGMVFQNPTPFPRSIYYNVAYGLLVQGHTRPDRAFGFLRRPRSADDVLKSDHPVDKRVVASLQESALWPEVKDRLHMNAYRLSGGQQQRLCIARSLAVKPEILLLDEPCSELDPLSTRHIEDTLLNIKKNYTVVIVTHNLHQARRIADQVVFFHQGEIVEEGDADTIFNNPKEKLTAEYISGAFG